MPRGEKSCFPADPSSGTSLAVIRFGEGVKASRQQTAEAGLVGYWPGDVSHGVWVRDRSGNGLHGFIVGRVTATEGRMGPGLRLRGGFVEVPHCQRLNVEAGLTLMAWVRPERVGSMRLIDKAPAGHNHAFLFDTHPENRLRFITRFGAIGIQEAIPVRAWSHVAASFDGSARRIYVDGQLRAERKAKGVLDTTGLPLRLGADSDGRSQFRGVLDEVRIYDHALDAGEIRRVAGSDGGG